ncbi:MAG: UDP-2,3-diacylglucosamine diphosphatase LpxI [Rhizobiaceae bacterium]
MTNRQAKADLTEPLAIIAGNGRLPLQIAERLVARSGQSGQSGQSPRSPMPVFIVGIRGEADPEIEKYPHEWCDWEQIGRIFKVIKQRGISNIVLAGGVIGRPEIKLRKLDWGAIKTLPGLLAALLGGDNQILSGVITAIEKRGFTVCNLAEILPEMTVKPGSNTTTSPKAAQKKQMAEGYSVTRAMGQFDIGQACVVVGSRAVALEGAEGTDAMLSRVADMRANGRLPNRRGGVLIKAVKPGQDERADLPAIGPDTIESVHKAGLLGIGVEAGKTLIIDMEETLQLAEQHGIFIFGFDARQMDAS